MASYEIVLPRGHHPGSRKGQIMKPAGIFGIILIILGVLALTFKSFSFTDRDSHDLGPVDIVTEDKETVPISPILGGIAIVGGIALLLTSRRSRA
jgi:hypothetical protein